MQVQTQTKAVPQPYFTPVRAGFLQRQCTCGQHTGAGECTECRQKREGTLQRMAVNSMSTAARSGEASAHNFSSPRFSHDFSAVPNHAIVSGAIDFDSPEAGAESQDAGISDATAGQDSGTSDAARGFDASARETVELPGTRATEGEGTDVARDLSWSQVLLFPHDALWFFCGEHPSGFSTTATLSASGFSDPTHLTWRITRGADKIAFQGRPVGADVIVRSLAGSIVSNDVSIEVREDARSFTGRLTVRKPHHLIQRFVHDNPGLPPGIACPAGCAPPCGFWTEIGYRVVDNVGGTIVGALVNESFPGATTSDQLNNWPVIHPNGGPTDGTFPDNWAVLGCAASGTNPLPVASTSANAGQSIDRMPHEFFVGSATPGQGCRVQRHTAHRFLGFARHEGIVTPAP